MKLQKQNFRELEMENGVRRSNVIELGDGTVSQGWCSIGGGFTITMLVVKRGKSQVRRSLKTREEVGWWRSSGEEKLRDKCNMLALFGLLDL